MRRSWRQKAAGRLLRGTGSSLRSVEEQLVLEDHLLRLLHARQIDTIVDVGANAGQTGKLFRSLGFTGRIVSLEPASQPYAALQQACGNDELWTCAKVAASDATGQRELHIAELSQLTSFLNTTERTTQQYGPARQTGTEVVNLVRLDEWLVTQLPDLTGRSILLKLDTQGHDLPALRGATGLLAQVEILMTEMSVIPIYEGTADLFEYLPIVLELGYSLTGLYPVARDGAQRIMEFDCVLIRGAAEDWSL